MKNILLGKTVKAMYKLSGKTLQQLSDESELTLDTINNLFYARIQKPGFAGVCAFVKACGYRIEDLTRFLDYAESLPETADITEEFTKYLTDAEDTAPKSAVPVSDTEPCRSTAAETVSYKDCENCRRMSEMQTEEIRQLRRMNLLLTAALVAVCVIGMILVCFMRR